LASELVRHHGVWKKGRRTCPSTAMRKKRGLCRHVHVSYSPAAPSHSHARCARAQIRSGSSGQSSALVFSLAMLKPATRLPQVRVSPSASRGALVLAPLCREAPLPTSPAHWRAGNPRAPRYTRLPPHSPKTMPLALTPPLPQFLMPASPGGARRQAMVRAGMRYHTVGQARGTLRVKRGEGGGG
jgi:hypothetical protein